MEYTQEFYIMVASLIMNLILGFIIYTLKAREKFILKTSHDMIQISESFSNELQKLKHEVDES